VALRFPKWRVGEDSVVQIKPLVAAWLTTICHARFHCGVQQHGMVKSGQYK